MNRYRASSSDTGYPERTLTDWLTALKAGGWEQKRTGTNSYAGPCPLCDDGDDRFHLTLDNDRVRVGCRKCIDGCPDSGTRYGRLLKKLFGGREKNSTRRSSAKSAPAIAPTEDPESAKAMAYARSLWEEAIPADDVRPARRYLARGWVWPPFGINQLLPPSMRWLPISAKPIGKTKPNGKKLLLPINSAGALLFAFTTPGGDVTAVQFEALTTNGETPRRRYRIIEGRCSGDRYIRIEARQPNPCCRKLVIVEGVRDVLAAWWIWQDSPVWGTGGTSGLRSVKSDDLTDFDGVILAGDGDESGQDALQNVENRLFGAGVRGIELWSRKDSGDLADYLKEQNRNTAAQYLERIAEKRVGLDATELSPADLNEAIRATWASWWTSDATSSAAAPDFHQEQSRPVNGRKQEQQPEPLPPAFELCCRIFDAEVLTFNSPPLPTNTPPA